MISYIRQTYTPQLTLICIPYLVMTVILFFNYSINWLYVIIFMFLFGIIGNGVVGHRLISHRQFLPANWIRPILYLLCTLAAFAPVWYWRTQHWHHHKFSDEKIDVHSPHTQNFWDSFFGWALKKKFIKIILKTEKTSLRESLNNPLMKFFHKYNYSIILLFILILGIWSPEILLAYLIFYWIEIVRLGLITSLAHMKLPFSYRNFDTNDKSYNNLILGYVTFGFGWHNNHHSKPMNLDTQIKWWEFDLEAKIAKLISLVPGSR